MSPITLAHRPAPRPVRGAAAARAPPVRRRRQRSCRPSSAPCGRRARGGRVRSATAMHAPTSPATAGRRCRSRRRCSGSVDRRARRATSRERRVAHRRDAVDVARRSGRRRRSRPPTPPSVRSRPGMPVRRPIREMPMPEMMARFSGTSIMGQRPSQPVTSTGHDTVDGRPASRASKRDAPALDAREPAVLDRRRPRRAAHPAVHRVPPLGAPAGGACPACAGRARVRGGERTRHDLHVHAQPSAVSSRGPAALRGRHRRARRAGRPAAPDQHRQLRARPVEIGMPVRVLFEQHGEIFVPVFEPAEP